VETKGEEKPPIVLCRAGVWSKGGLGGTPMKGTTREGVLSEEGISITDVRSDIGKGAKWHPGGMGVTKVQSKTESEKSSRGGGLSKKMELSRWLGWIKEFKSRTLLNYYEQKKKQKKKIGRYNSEGGN